MGDTMRTIRTAGWVLALVLGAACSDSSGPAPRVDGLRAATATSVEGPAGARLPQWMAVQVLDQFSEPLAGVAVSWSVEAGGGSVQAVDAVTDAEGVARAYWTLGRALNVENRLAATVEGAQPVVFTGAARYSDERQIGVNTTVTAPATGMVGTAQTVTLVFRNPDGTPSIGAPVAFTVTSGGGTVTPTSTVTDSAGRATAAWTLGTTAGEQSMSYSVLGLGWPIVTTRATAAAPATLTAVDGGFRLTAPGDGQPVAVGVRDAYGNVVQGATVEWTVLAGGGSVSSAQTQTNASGTAATGWTAGAAVDGTVQRVRASVAGAAPVEFSRITKAFFFVLRSPPAPGPGATVTGTELRVEAGVVPYRALPREADRVTSFTLSVGDRTASFGLVNAPWRWMARLSLEGLPAGPLTYRVRAVDDQGREHEESVTFTYAP
jgi:hypothetical protein